MCGIAGWFGETPAGSTENQALQQMARAIAHRGPDDEGLWLQRRVAFAHRRLSIIDLECGHQPMHSPCGRFTIVYNGEIYNHRVLRQTLPDYPFRTQSDTEVILALYQTRGIDGFNRLRGMFAFALWDDTEKLGILVRDCFGIKPLFVHQQANMVFFGSEAKALLAHPQVHATLDESILHSCLNLRYPLDGQSLFKGIHQLQPGTIQWFGSKAGQTRLLPQPPDKLPLTTAFEDTVQAHLVADVPVSVYLSGGIDSALIASTAGRHDDGMDSFTLEVGDDPREADNAARTASLLGLKNTRLKLPEIDEELLKSLIWHLETPKINALQTFLLARETAKHSKVALSGVGGDEWFYGYNAHRLFYLANLLGPAKSILSPLGGFAKRLFTSDKQFSESGRAMDMLSHLGEWPKVYGILRNVWDSPDMRQHLYGERMLDLPLPDTFDALTARWPQHPDAVTAMSRYEIEQKMIHDLLWQEDRCSMAFGLEVRTPFIDTDFSAIVGRYHRKELFPWGSRKSRLKQLAAVKLPKEILQRPKSGFQVDAGDFVTRNLAPISRHYLDPGQIRRHGIFNEKTLIRFASLPPIKRHRWHHLFVYMAVMVHLWLEVFEPTPSR